MFEGINKYINPNDWVDFAIRIGYLVVTKPLEYWNMVPFYVRWPIYFLILLFAIFLLWISIKDFKRLWNAR